MAIATEAFKNVYDKGGNPYSLHLLRVWEGVKDESEDVQCAAWLHDLIEDFPKDWDLWKLSQEGFNGDVLRIVDLLTHRKDESYMTYIERIATNPSATAVKLSDLRDNSDITRLKGLTKKDFRRMEQYHWAYTYLSKI